jgi:hypothetical protein
MALKNSTNFRVTTRDLTIATDPRVFGKMLTNTEDGSEKLNPDSAELLEQKIDFKGIVDNKIQAEISLTMKINGWEVLLKGEPTISLNHFELSLTGNSAKLTPEEAEKIQKRIELLQQKLQLGIAPTEDELMGE